MLTQALKIETRLGQTMTPRMQQAVRLLLMSSQDYEQELRDIANRNPFLLIESDAAAATAPGDTPSAGADDTPREAYADPAPHESWADVPAARDAGIAGSGDGQGTATECACETGLQQHLLAQAGLMRLSERELLMVGALIESLEDDGYLRTEPVEITRWLRLDPAPTPIEWKTALGLVQSLDPAGVGARDLVECLLLQLRNEATADAALAREVVRHHVQHLARGDVRTVARALQYPEDEVRDAFARIRRLDPHPGWRHQQVPIHYVRPDVIVRRVAGCWEAQLNPAAMPRVCVDDNCAALFLQHRQGTAHAELGAHLQEARWAVRNARQRFATILAVAQAITRRQQAFFDNGPLAMRPLALRDIAADVGVHESTVSRVTNNKYMDTPAGLIELKRFFARPMQLASGGACTPMAIRGLVREIIESEDRADPLSDVQITHCLTRQGLHVARRTVTKYRQMLKFPPVDQRRVEPPTDAAPSAD